MKAFRFLAFAAAVLCIVSCGKGRLWEDEPIDMNSNWWYRSNIVYGGIRTIDEGLTGYEYNKQGRLIRVHDDLMEKSITYNSKGLPYSVSYRNYDERGTLTYSSEQHFEYYNYGKYCPVISNPGDEEFKLLDNGLLPGLSRIVWETSDKGRIESEYVFSGNTLTIVTTNLEDPADVYENLVVEFRGDYPYSFRGKGYYFSVTGYQRNGMFDEFREGYLDNGVLTNDFYYCIVRDFNEMMLVESIDEDVYEGAIPVEKRRQDFVYNELGDCIDFYYEAPGVKEHTINSYEYDDFDNWYSMVSFVRDELSGRQIGGLQTIHRTIRYW